MALWGDPQSRAVSKQKLFFRPDVFIPEPAAYLTPTLSVCHILFLKEESEGKRFMLTDTMLILKVF